MFKPKVVSIPRNVESTVQVVSQLNAAHPTRDFMNEIASNSGQISIGTNPSQVYKIERGEPLFRVIKNPEYQFQPGRPLAVRATLNGIEDVKFTEDQIVLQNIRVLGLSRKTHDGGESIQNFADHPIILVQAVQSTKNKTRTKIHVGDICQFRLTTNDSFLKLYQSPRVSVGIIPVSKAQHSLKDVINALLEETLANFILDFVVFTLFFNTNARYDTNASRPAKRHKPSMYDSTGAPGDSDTDQEEQHSQVHQASDEFSDSNPLDDAEFYILGDQTPNIVVFGSLTHQSGEAATQPVPIGSSSPQSGEAATQTVPDGSSSPQSVPAATPAPQGPTFGGLAAELTPLMAQVSQNANTYIVQNNIQNSDEYFREIDEKISKALVPAKLIHLLMPMFKASCSDLLLARLSGVILRDGNSGGRVDIALNPTLKQLFRF